MPEVVNSHVLQPGARADAAPGLLQIGDVGARHLAGDDPGIAVLARQVCQQGAGLGSPSRWACRKSTVLHTAPYRLMLALRDAFPRRMPLAWLFATGVARQMGVARVVFDVVVTEQLAD